MIKSTLCVLLILLSGCVMGTVSRGAFADESPKQLTNQSIEDFYKLSARMYKADFDSFLRFLDQSTHPSIKGRNTTSIFLPGQPALESSENVSKDMIMSSARESYDSMKNASLQNVITSISISKNGRSATIKDSNIFEGMAIPTPSGNLSASGQGVCEDELILSPETDTIQIKNTNCVVTLKVGGF